MKTKTQVKAGYPSTYSTRPNHNETRVSQGGASLRVRTSVKAGGKKANHNETRVGRR